MSEFLASLLRGKAFNLEKKTAHDGGKGKKRSARQNDGHSNGETAVRVAKEYGVSPRTINRDGQFAAAVDVLAKSVPELHDLVQNGHCPVPKSFLVDARLLSIKSRRALSRNRLWRVLGNREKHDFILCFQGFSPCKGFGKRAEPIPSVCLFGFIPLRFRNELGNGLETVVKSPIKAPFPWKRG